MKSKEKENMNKWFLCPVTTLLGALFQTNSWSQNSDSSLVAAKERVPVSALVSRKVVAIVWQADVCPCPVRKVVLSCIPCPIRRCVTPMKE